MGQVLEFTDLGVETGLWTEANTVYKYDFEVDGLEERGIELGNQTYIPLDDWRKKLAEHSPAPELAAITLYTSRKDQPRWSRYVRIYLGRGIKNRFVILGIERQD
jgi:hypothetical protein